MSRPIPVDVRVRVPENLCGLRTMSAWVPGVVVWGRGRSGEAVFSGLLMGWAGLRKPVGYPE